MCAGGVDMCHLSLSTAEAHDGGGATHNEDHSVGLRNLSSDVCFANVASFGHPVPLPGRQLAVYFSKQSSMFLFIYLVTWISSDSPLLACVPSINNKTSKKSNNIFQDSKNFT